MRLVKLENHDKYKTGGQVSILDINHFFVMLLSKHSRQRRTAWRDHSSSNTGENESQSRNISIYFCHRYSGARLQEIGERFELSSEAIAQASHRLRLASEKDTQLRELLDGVAKELGVVIG